MLAKCSTMSVTADSMYPITQSDQWKERTTITRQACQLCISEISSTILYTLTSTLGAEDFNIFIFKAKYTIFQIDRVIDLGQTSLVTQSTGHMTGGSGRHGGRQCILAGHHSELKTTGHQQATTDLGCFQESLLGSWEVGVCLNHYTATSPVYSNSNHTQTAFNYAESWKIKIAATILKTRGECPWTGTVSADWVFLICEGD